MALGSKQYASYFALAFLLPFFVGGLLDGVVILITEHLRKNQPVVR
jgi:hypothetical protein